MASNLSTKLPWELAQPRWAAQLNPIVANSLLAGNQINDIVLTATTPKAVNHLLGRTPQGWFVVDSNANAVIWRSQPWNTTNIVLESSANVTINIWVY